MHKILNILHIFLCIFAVIAVEEKEGGQKVVGQKKQGRDAPAPIFSPEFYSTHQPAAKKENGARFGDGRPGRFLPISHH
jgi:hypothetical protein